MIVRSGGGWLARAAFALLGLAIAAVAFFAVTIALVIGVLVALVIGARWWWLMRRVRKAAAAQGPIEGEYTVVEREPLDGPKR
ncbi:MAG TPA: hypothetical protein VHP37_20475 [Burkholderiales bacterium]|nr:hypothetical protein [Burkholderiales bacterium]